MCFGMKNNLFGPEIEKKSQTFGRIHFSRICNTHICKKCVKLRRSWLIGLDPGRTSGVELESLLPQLLLGHGQLPDLADDFRPWRKKMLTPAAIQSSFQTTSKSYDFWICNYNATVVVGKSVFGSEKSIIFILKTRYAICGVEYFNTTGVVTRDRRIGSWVTRGFMWKMAKKYNPCFVKYNA
jgi:hypothetical protein